MTVWFWGGGGGGWGITVAFKLRWKTWQFIILWKKKKSTWQFSSVLSMQISLSFMNNDKHSWNTHFQPQRGKETGNSAKETTFKARRCIRWSVHGLCWCSCVSGIFKEALLYSWVTFQALFTISLKQKKKSIWHLCRSGIRKSQKVLQETYSVWKWYRSTTEC